MKRAGLHVTRANHRKVGGCSAPSKKSAGNTYRPARQRAESKKTVFTDAQSTSTPTDAESDALSDLAAEYGAIDRDDYWLTEDKGGAEISYES